jgi:SAM-dependent methyltransferase
MTTTIDPAEVAKFEAMAAEWWDPNGKFKPLHLMNPCRLDYITSQIAAEFDRNLAGPAPFAGLRILDIGCGGGLLSEPMARLGATVVGADAAPRNIPVAQVHAEQSGLTIDYRHTTAEDLAAAEKRGEAKVRDEITAKEKAEAEVLAAYLPAAMSDDELNAIVAAEVASAAAAGNTGMKAMGAVVKAVRERAGSSADGSKIADLVKAALA